MLALLVPTLILGLVLVLQERRHSASEAAWAVERRELTNRVQRPELLPQTPISEFVSPDFEVDELDKVGTIQWPEED